MKKITIKLFVCFVTIFFLVSCATFKKAGKDVGHATKDVTTKVGHVSRDTVKAIGKGTKEAAKDIKDSIEEE